MNQQPNKFETSPEVASWNRQRTPAELADFINRKLAALSSINLEDINE